jgi:Fe-S-cluster-containing hydrogenase component 2
MCEIVCPLRIFRINGKKAEITAKEKCIECGACSLNCAFGAITVDSGPGCAAAVLASGLKKGSKAACNC